MDKCDRICVYFAKVGSELHFIDKLMFIMDSSMFQWLGQYNLVKFKCISLQSCPLIFSLPWSSSDQFNIRLFSSELHQISSQDDHSVQILPLHTTNSSLVAINIVSQRNQFPHFVYQYFPAGKYLNIESQSSIRRFPAICCISALLCILSLLSLMMPLCLTSARVGFLIVILVLLSALLR